MRSVLDKCVRKSHCTGDCGATFSLALVQWGAAINDETTCQGERSQRYNTMRPVQGTKLWVCGDGSDIPGMDIIY